MALCAVIYKKEREKERTGIKTVPTLLPKSSGGTASHSWSLTPKTLPTYHRKDVANLSKRAVKPSDSSVGIEGAFLMGWLGWVD